MTQITSPVVLESNGPTVIAFTYATIAITLILGLIRTGTSRWWKRPFGWDDAFLMVAVMLAGLETVMTSVSVENGLGRYVRPGNANQLYNFYKTMYSAEILFIMSMTAAKTSIIQLLRRVAPHDSKLYRCSIYFHIAIGSWALFSIFAIGFQCGLPYPWIYLPTRCAASGALWYPVMILTILSDIILAGYVLPVLPELQMTARQRRTTAALFATRLVVPIAAIVQLALLAPALHDINQPRAMIKPAIARQIVLNLSLITAIILVLYRPVAMLAPGKETSAQHHESKPHITIDELPTKSDKATKNNPIVISTTELTPTNNSHFAEHSQRLTLGFDNMTQSNIKMDFSFDKETQAHTRKNRGSHLSTNSSTSSGEWEDKFAEYRLSTATKPKHVHTHAQ